ncbi:MAG: DUF4157 domain-containing protein [Candidatus Thiodiazotropha sp.]
MRTKNELLTADSTRRNQASGLPTVHLREQAVSLPNTKTPALQKSRCTCGGGCTKCATRSVNGIGVTLSHPHDALEHEADRLAARATGHMSPDSMISRKTLPIGPSHSYPSANLPPPNRLQLPSFLLRAFAMQGTSLGADVRGLLEPRFGQDFRDVRIHEGTYADVSAKVLNASAYTLGNHIVFAKGAYMPSTPRGMSLLAHELAHVVQQRQIGRFATDSNGSLLIQRKGVSYELGNPPDPGVEELALNAAPGEETFYQGLNVDQRRVMGWLRQYQSEIVLQEMLTGVDRRAIAGAIAWEALENVKWWITPSRAAGGPGKIHVQSSMFKDGRLAAPEEVEVRGLVPAQTYEQRVEILQTPSGAIQYIAAIMQAMAQDAQMWGFDIWRNPGVLTWGFHSKYVDTFEQRMKEKATAGETTFDTSPSPMAVWVHDNMDYLEASVGTPSARNTNVSPRPKEPVIDPMFGGPM